jgi:hypothetical protein
MNSFATLISLNHHLDCECCHEFCVNDRRVFASQLDYIFALIGSTAQ